MKDAEFRMLLNLWMVTDPWPLSDEDHLCFKSMLERECFRRGFVCIPTAYHDFHV